MRNAFPIIGSRTFAHLLWASIALMEIQHVVEGGSHEISVEKRSAWTTSRIMGSPEPPLPYITEPVFPSLKFQQCLELTAIPGSNRLLVVEQAGKVFTFPNQPDIATADLVVNFAEQIPGVQQVYSLTFHPDFQQNRYCYVCYIKGDNDPEGTHVARFRMTDADPPTIDVTTETTMLTWRSGGHNGCCLKFGPDGCLYISTGDAAPANPPDTMKTGQDLSDLLSSILRIDVDHADAEKNYRIPADNPFVDLQGTRGEVWAYGLRNPWRMSFDRVTGDLWVGDVGWELWEMLYRVERGGNYGWAVMEGRQSTNPEWPRGPSPILPPTIDHPHTESSSITEGLTYYGARLKELHGTHVYGDYDTGKFWGFRYVNGDVVDHRELADTTHRVVSFGEDHQGECLILDHIAGTIHRLAPNPQPDQSQTFPRKISESGLFASMEEQTPAAGVMPYSINAELWSDDADAERFVAVPHELSIKAEGSAWTFPTDSVLVRTLSLEMHRGDPASRRRIETQILHYDGIDWMPYTYQWNDEQTDASLVGATGTENTFEIMDPEATGGKRAQTWRFAGRAECQRCHNRWSGPALAFNTPQLNKDLDLGGKSHSQIDLFAQIGLLEQPVAAENRPKLASPGNMSATLDDRARAYLQVNCAHCHRMHSGGAVLSLMHYDVPLDKTNMVGMRPSQGTFGIYAAQVIAPRDPFRSIMLYRMAKFGGGRMPHIGSLEVDRDGIDLISQWIEQMPAESAPDAISHESTARLRNDETAALARLRESNTLAEQSELIEGLLASPSGALRLLRSVDHHDLPEVIAAHAVDAAVKHGDVSIRDLFERFLPAEQRVKRLGSVVQPEQILSLSGDAVRGRTVFFEQAGVSCRNCHRIQKDGKEIGPELTTIGKKLTRIQLLESILQPSKFIEPKYVTHLAETKDGQILTGILLEKDGEHVVLKDAQDKVSRLPINSIEQLVPQQQSLMPDLLVRDLTAQQVADLLAYLSSLK
jgi:uncharacterized repeat protein (TIGR03806 family)